ncbi:dolichyl-diphosphooligosaccharide--protein glycosyltransferase subunit DAD1-like isoform X2 [Phoenix dactylifera]|uniref:Dolichyl-diphosphooligosaccharide--protein glycosyltransferase subunit DAD1 n=1 Tax=Phoenix dactylifera TaxID=42345 RepID=A0A8B8ZQU4_PHODC|nr:dolichyl-diphosphooligosaccharide--protein glycosyltransferase subunit DAD1-like isoform X2 [Phoenix dactylifera]
MGLRNRDLREGPRLLPPLLWSTLPWLEASKVSVNLSPPLFSSQPQAGRRQTLPRGPQIIDLYVVYAIVTAVIQVVYMGIVGSFPFNSFLSGVLSCVGTAVLAVCLRIQVNKENKEFKDLPPERAYADFVLCNLVLHLVVMNFLG